MSFDAFRLLGDLFFSNTAQENRNLPEELLEFLLNGFIPANLLLGVIHKIFHLFLLCKECNKECNSINDE